MSREELERDRYREMFAKEGLYIARCFGSKTGYIRRHPQNKVAFNAQVYRKSVYDANREVIEDWRQHGHDLEMWCGDIDMDFDRLKLENIASDLGEDIVVTRESGHKFAEVNLADIVSSGTSGHKP